MSSMGMMHEGYFVGRKELTNWIRQHFEPSFQKVENLASGVVYCQILNSVHPGAIQMGKVKRDAKTEVDFIHNFKLLQSGFNKKKIDRFIDVDKLTKRSFQFNMEFLQFMKAYWDTHAPAEAGAEGIAEPAANVANAPPAAAPKKAASRVPNASAPSARTPVGGTVDLSKGQLQEEVTELKLSVENLERERDFYYTKLREVEVLCQSKEDQEIPFLNEVLAILYKMDEGEEGAAEPEAAEAPEE